MIQYSQEPRKFLKGFPTTWDETKLINGYPGEMVVIARRKGKLWYVAGLNGKDAHQTLNLSFNFLGNSNYSFQLFKDGALNNRVLAIGELYHNYAFDGNVAVNFL